MGYSVFTSAWGCSAHELVQNGRKSAQSETEGLARIDKLIRLSFLSGVNWPAASGLRAQKGKRFEMPTRKPAAKPAKKAAPAAKKAARKPNAAFMKPMTPSDKLAEVVGSKALPRTEVTKKLWAYIKKNGLQDKVNKRMINADDKLKDVFGGKKQVSMFEMTKLVNKHLK